VVYIEVPRVVYQRAVVDLLGRLPLELLRHYLVREEGHYWLFLTAEVYVDDMKYEL